MDDRVIIVEKYYNNGCICFRERYNLINQRHGLQEYFWGSSHQAKREIYTCTYGVKNGGVVHYDPYGRVEFKGVYINDVLYRVFA